MQYRIKHIDEKPWQDLGFRKIRVKNYYIYFWLPEETLELRVKRDHVPYDVWEMGFTVVPFGQGFKDMFPPTKEFMKLRLEQKPVY